MNTKHIAIGVLLCVVSLTAFAQRIPFRASTQAPLTLRADAPHWWSFGLPDDRGILEQNAEVTVLEKKKLGTIFGKETWYRVEIVRNPDDARDSAATPGTTGWIFGGSTGERLTYLPRVEG